MATPSRLDTSSKRGARISLTIGVAVGLALQSLVLWWSGGGLGAADTVRFVFTPASGFPLIDLPTDGWERMVEKVAALHFTGAPRFDWGLEPTLLARNSLYFLAGQSLGLLPYALAPLGLLLLGVRRRVAVAWGLALGLTTLGALLLEPFNLAGGSPGNPHVLPLIAATVLIWRPRSPFDGALGAQASAGILTLAASLFLVPLWLGAQKPPSVERESGIVARHAGPLARAILPYELSQQTLPGGPVYDHGGLRIRLLSASVAEKDLDILTLRGAEPAHLWVASPTELGSLTLRFGEEAPATIELLDDRATLLDRELRADGGVSFRLALGARRHVMWWSPRAQWVYRVDFRLPEAGEQRLEWNLVGETTEVGGIR